MLALEIKYNSANAKEFYESIKNQMFSNERSKANVDLDSKNKTIIFHSGSKLFLNDLSDLISNFIDIRKPIKEYIQREKYYSYQLNLNKKETELLLSQMRTWDNGTPVALSFLSK